MKLGRDGENRRRSEEGRGCGWAGGVAWQRVETWRAGADLGSSDGRDRGGRVARKGYVPRRAEREQDEMWALIGPCPAKCQVDARSVSAKVSAR